MADPLTIGIGVGSLLGLGGSLLAGKSGGSPTPTAPAALPPDPSTPAQTPSSKPAAKSSQQQSFLSGAAALQQAGGTGMNTGSSGGKSLLGQ